MPTKKKRITISLTPLQASRLERLSKRYDISMSKVVREAVDYYWRFAPDRVEGNYQKPKKSKTPKVNWWSKLVDNNNGR